MNFFFKPSLMHKTIGLIPSTGKKEEGRRNGLGKVGRDAIF